MKTTNLIYCSLILVLMMASCSITSTVPTGQQLLTENKIEHKQASSVDLSDETDFLKQRTNRRMFGFLRFHLRTYLIGARGIQKGKDSTWFRRTMMQIGEPPVLVDSGLCDLTAKRLSDFYFSKGFLENKVTYEIKTFGRKDKKAKVVYIIDLGDFKKIHSVEYEALTADISHLVDSSMNKSILIPGQRLDFERIQNERNRLTDLMKNNGYYYFNSSFIDFSVDTNRLVNEADIVVNIRNARGGAEHTRQRIKNVIILVGVGPRRDTVSLEGLKFVHNTYKINNQILANRIHFRPWDYYNASNVSKSYSDLLNTGLFRFVTIRFAPSVSDSLALDVEIVLQTASKHVLTWEPQGIFTEHGADIRATSERNVGFGNNIVLRNRNVFGNAEAFNITSNAALETQLKGDGNRWFSNIRHSLSSEFILPSMLFFEQTNFGKDVSNKTTRFSASYLYENNLNYIRHVIPFTYSYTFQKGKTAFAVTPFRLSYNRSIVEQEFLDGVSAGTRDYINQLLTNNVITGPVFSLYWNDKNRHPKHYWSIRSNALELSGSMFATYFNLFTDKTGLNKEVLGVKFSQYARSDIDVSLNHIIDENNSVVYRFNTGIGVPFGNSEFLPFERRFFVGGNNGLRAWRPRAIGPGGYVDDQTSGVSIEKTGEVLIQANAEYRFGIIDNLLDGALFVDAGNIWNIKEDDQFVDGAFKFNNFYKQIAFNTGIGTRFDLSFLIFRVDWGIALHDPSYPAGDRWVIGNKIDRDWITNNTALNFAVGYPF